MQKFILSLCLAAIATGANAKIQLPAMMSDNMVLQQNQDVTLWGKSDSGKIVTVTPSWSNNSYTVVTDANGNWSIDIPTPAAGYTPYSITFDDGEPTTVSNVLIGEVWLASGQSNMEMPLRGFGGCPVRGGYDEIAKSADKADKVRFINIPRVQSYTPLEDTQARWVVASPETSPEFSATAWYFACRLNDVLDIPVGIVNCAYGGARVESWTPREILETYSDVSLDPKDIEPMTHYHRPMLMYNAMFVPVKDYTYRGIIWYQGCSNVSTAETYTDRLAKMVQHWRDQIGQGNIPFYQVEIAPYQYDNPVEVGKAAMLREAQHEAARVIDNCGIIPTNDLVEPYERHNIHPANKADVGKRLAHLALNKTYGKHQFPCEQITYVSSEPKDGAMVVSFDVPEGGICRNYDIIGFELAGDDRKYYPAEDVIFDWRNNKMIVRSADVPNPVAVRYCFQDWLPGTLYGADFLPAAPFRSEK